MAGQVEIVCNNCGKEFTKAKKEYDRQLRNGKKNFYCSRTCVGKHNVKNLGDHGGYHFSGGSVKDEYSPFRPHLKRVRTRYVEKSKDYNISLSYLKELWETQNGICPLTGVNLILETGVSNPNYSASLDRINSDIGYMKGNVQFISLTANHAKNKFSEDVIQEFFEIIKHGGEMASRAT